MEGADAVARRQTTTCPPGQAVYVTRLQPHRRASACLENTDPARPFISADVIAEGVRRWIGAYGGR